MDDSLLRSVRSEILNEISFTPKETDIYKIHQSGDLANLDGLEDSALAKLPSLLKLRDALYSSAFRKWIAEVGNSGPLSGKKTDMAINVYTPGCHLLCHDDVIGTRRLSYILYLTDPDKPWQPEWGGALRLYPTTPMKADDGTVHNVPGPEFSLSIPPSWNQLSFFTIQPGLSFHDVEEVYHPKPSDDGEPDTSDDGGRVRMAISGWFHIPQEGEEGYEEGLEEKLAERSSLSQLQQAKADQFDLPQTETADLDIPPVEEEDLSTWSDEDFQFLIRFIDPSYLVPETLEQLQEQFSEESAITLTNFLQPKFAAILKDYISSLDRQPEAVLPARAGTDPSFVGVAKPPHKQRFLYRKAMPSESTESGDYTPLDELLDQFFTSPLFARWLQLVTNLDFCANEILARRFRCGSDYTLASESKSDGTVVEICLGITPSWGSEQDEDDNSDGGEEENKDASSKEKEDEDAEWGGYEAYMVADGDDEEDDENIEEPSGTGAGHRGKTKSDPAIYKASGDDDDDGIAFSMPACWNNMSIVARDLGLLKFVKYVSASAPGDRWDVTGSFGVTGSVGGG